ncbi:MAG: hypothetical protein J6E44_04600, partial [Lachnospiraceae bacterium]|nr:hypothetical protein [Lachnospiraceae bacterium]
REREVFPNLPAWLIASATHTVRMAEGHRELALEWAYAVRKQAELVYLKRRKELSWKQDQMIFSVKKK